MLTTIGDLLPLAVGIAVSPIPIIAAILMLLSPNAKTTGVGFLCGWIVGIVVAVTVFTLLSSTTTSDDGSSRLVGVLQIVLGVLLLGVAVRQWQGRPVGDAEPEMPKWMAAIDSFTPVRAFGLGFLLAALNPKNLLLGMAAGLSLGHSDIPTGQDVVAIVVFTVLASSTVAIPVVAYLISTQRWVGPLQSLRHWLARNNATVMAVLLLVIGFVLIGKGLGNL